jgi:hypothetical protein
VAVSRSSYTAPVRMSVRRFSSLIRPACDTLVTSVSQAGSSQPAHEKTRACLPRGPAVGAAGQGGGQGSSGRAALGRHGNCGGARLFVLRVQTRGATEAATAAIGPVHCCSWPT